MLSNEKIAAIYGLREAVETKVRAEQALEREPSSDAQAALLDATLDVEAKTQDAIEVCHRCGHVHPPDAGHLGELHDNVIEVDFGGRSERDGGEPPG
jgi:hypothetical protein